MVRQRFDDDPNIRIVLAGAKNAGAAHAVKLLENYIIVFLMECQQQILARRYQRRGLKIGKGCCEKLFIAISKTTGVIDDQRTFRLTSLQEVSRIDIIHVKRRVFAHHDDVDLAEGERFLFCTLEPL